MTTETKQNDSKLVPEVQRQYSLLREFNLEQAQAGDEILSVLSPSYSYVEVIQEVKFKGVTSNLQEVFFEDKQGEGYVRGTQRVKMKPLCWIEGKPVYKGDVLYYNFITSKGLVVVEALTFEDGSVGIRTNSGGAFHFTQELTWDRPKEPHVHQELIDAYNKGAEIQYYSSLTRDGYEWRDIQNPCWSVTDKYRIKPKELKKKSGWINLWKPSCNRHPRCLTVDNTVWSTKDAALALANIHSDEYITTIEIHWEE